MGRWRRVVSGSGWSRCVYGRGGWCGRGGGGRGCPACAAGWTGGRGRGSGLVGGESRPGGGVPGGFEGAFEADACRVWPAWVVGGGADEVADGLVDTQERPELLPYQGWALRPQYDLGPAAFDRLQLADAGLGLPAV